MNKRTAAVVIFCAALVGYVLLAVFAPGADPRGVFIFAATGAAWLGLHGENQQVKAEAEVIKKKAAETSDVINKIHKQTNGVLDERIATAVRKELGAMFEEHDRNKVHTVVIERKAPRKQRRFPKLSGKGEN